MYANDAHLVYPHAAEAEARRAAEEEALAAHGVETPSAAQVGRVPVVVRREIEEQCLSPQQY